MARPRKAIVAGMLSEWKAFIQNEKKEAVQAEAEPPTSPLAVEADGIGNASPGKDIQELKAEQVWIR